MKETKKMITLASIILLVCSVAWGVMMYIVLAPPDEGLPGAPDTDRNVDFQGWVDDVNSEVLLHDAFSIPDPPYPITILPEAAGRLYINGQEAARWDNLEVVTIKIEYEQ